MTVDEMRKRIKKECDKRCFNCKLSKYRYTDFYNCYDGNDEEIKEYYNILNKKEESKMKNEFDFNELKAGWAIKLPSGSFCVGMQTDENEITFFERFNNGELNAVLTKEDIINNQCRNEHEISFYPIEVYGYSENYELFDPSTRPLLWKKEEDKNTKEYNKDPNRIYKFCIELAQEWSKEPNLRFGQLIVNTLGEDPFYVEDDEALEKIKMYFKEK